MDGWKQAAGARRESRSPIQAWPLAMAAARRKWSPSLTFLFLCFRLFGLFFLRVSEAEDECILVLFSDVFLFCFVAVSLLWVKGRGREGEDAAKRE